MVSRKWIVNRKGVSWADWEENGALRRARQWEHCCEVNVLLILRAATRCVASFPPYFGVSRNILCISPRIFLTSSARLVFQRNLCENVLETFEVTPLCDFSTSRDIGRFYWSNYLLLAQARTNSSKVTSNIKAVLSSTVIICTITSRWSE